MKNQSTKSSLSTTDVKCSRLNLADNTPIFSLYGFLINNFYMPMYEMTSQASAAYWFRQISFASTI